MAKYELTSDEQELMEEIFNMAQRVVDLQIDDETAHELQHILEDGADLFGIRQQEVSVTEDDDGTLRISVTELVDKELADKGPKLRVIDGDKPDSLEEEPR